MASDFKSLVALAEEIAIEQQASVPAVVKELLHYEILQVLMESGAASHLVFQGGTALRLCYKGIRYSEDLDFVGGSRFDPAIMSPFVEQLKASVNARYQLSIDVSEHPPNPNDNVPVGRWKAKVRMPAMDRSAKQGYFIHIEVAEIRSYTNELVQVHTVSDSLPLAYQSILLKAESKKEILADKLVALGGRSYVKQRDLWDIHMLAQAGGVVDTELVRLKLRDYHLARTQFIATLQSRSDQLRQRESVSAFQQEMARFLQAPHQALIRDEGVVGQMLTTVAAVVDEVSVDLSEKDMPLPEI